MGGLTLPHFHDNLHGACLADPSFPVLQAIQCAVGSGCKKRGNVRQVPRSWKGTAGQLLAVPWHCCAGLHCPLALPGRSQLSPDTSYPRDSLLTPHYSHIFMPQPGAH